jgi:hypothetical protein
MSKTFSISISGTLDDESPIDIGSLRKIGLGAIKSVGRSANRSVNISLRDSDDGSNSTVVLANEPLKTALGEVSTDPLTMEVVTT